jgi:hypothetical protein
MIKLEHTVKNRNAVGIVTLPANVKSPFECGTAFAFTIDVATIGNKIKYILECRRNSDAGVLGIHGSFDTFKYATDYAERELERYIAVAHVKSYVTWTCSDRCKACGLSDFSIHFPPLKDIVYFAIQELPDADGIVRYALSVIVHAGNDLHYVAYDTFTVEYSAMDYAMTQFFEYLKQRRLVDRFGIRLGCAKVKSTEFSKAKDEVKLGTKGSNLSAMIKTDKSAEDWLKPSDYMPYDYVVVEINYTTDFRSDDTLSCLAYHAKSSWYIAGTPKRVRRVVASWRPHPADMINLNEVKPESDVPKLSWFDAKKVLPAKKGCVLGYYKSGEQGMYASVYYSAERKRFIGYDDMDGCRFYTEPTHWAYHEDVLTWYSAGNYIPRTNSVIVAKFEEFKYEDVCVSMSYDKDSRQWIAPFPRPDSKGQTVAFAEIPNGPDITVGPTPSMSEAEIAVLSCIKAAPAGNVKNATVSDDLKAIDSKLDVIGINELNPNEVVKHEIDSKTVACFNKVIHSLSDKASGYIKYAPSDWTFWHPIADMIVDIVGPRSGQSCLYKFSNNKLRLVSRNTQQHANDLDCCVKTNLRIIDAVSVASNLAVISDVIERINRDAVRCDFCNSPITWHHSDSHPDDGRDVLACFVSGQYLLLRISRIVAGEWSFDFGPGQFLWADM